MPELGLRIRANDEEELAGLIRGAPRSVAHSGKQTELSHPQTDHEPTPQASVREPVFALRYGERLCRSQGGLPNVCRTLFFNQERQICPVLVKDC